MLGPDAACTDQAASFSWDSLSTVDALASCIELEGNTSVQGTKLMTPKKARAIWAIYVWCRRTDELVDGPNASRMNPRVGQAANPLTPCVCQLSGSWQCASWAGSASETGSLLGELSDVEWFAEHCTA